MVEPGAKPVSGKRENSSPPKLTTVKFKKYSTEPDPLAFAKKTPSQFITEVSAPQNDPNAWRPKPKIIELLNLADYSHQVNCVVPLDEPIFQPFPPEVTFHGFEPFKSYEVLLYLRNNDAVPRRVKVIPPESQFFSVRRVAAPGKEDGSKVASGMEVVYSITFSPQSNGDHACDVVVCTEREKFLVPVVAKGAAAALDLPDAIDFGFSAPTKLEARQTVLVRNVGHKAAAFSLRVEEPFSVSPSQGFLAPGEMLQLQVTFTPPAAGKFSGELELLYHDSGRVTYSTLAGAAVDVDVSLSQGTVALLPTYVTKMSQKTFKVVNASKYPVKFAVKAHASGEAEMAATTQRLGVLQSSFDAQSAGGPHHGSHGDMHHLSLNGALHEDEEESEDEDAILNNHTASLARATKSARRDLLLDKQLFKDSNFAMVPAEGTVAAHSSVEVVVQFTPDYAREYEVVAYIEVEGRTQRLPLVMQGKGLGPAAVFSYDVLDVGDTYCNTLHQYEVEIQNRGKIDVHYALTPPATDFGSMFTFEPSSGHLLGGQIQSIKVKLLSDKLGLFDETFKWSIRGSSVPLLLQFKGRVCGPTCEVDEETLDFGIVSYGFRYTKEITLTNTSDIPMRFSWRVPEDSGETKEFQILPQKGSVLPHGKHKIAVEFVPAQVMKYTAHMLVLDVPKVREAQLTVPIRAECAVPKIGMASSTLVFGECYVRYPYKQSITLLNQSKLPAKFEVLPQDHSSTGLAHFTVEPMSGGIPAMGEHTLEVTLETQTLGRVQLPVHIRVPGSKGKPLEAVIDARSMGPTLLFGAEGAPSDALKDATEIAYDRVAVLDEHVRAVQIHNPCLIPANFKLFIEGTDSVFTVKPREARLGPGESMVANVTLCMDDNQTFRDVLHVLVSEGADISIPLSAIGIGSTLVCPELSGTTLDFSHQFVGRSFQQSFVITNNGRKAMSLVWSNDCFEKVRQVYSKAARVAGKKFSLESVPPEEHPVFSINPERASIDSRSSASFIITGFAHNPGEVSEQLTCMANAGTNAKSAKKSFDIAAIALVATPLLDFSERVMEFRHSYTKGQPVAPIVKPLTVRNISKLPLSFTIKAQPPFALDRTSFQLAFYEGATINVSFDPAFKNDSLSGIVKQKLQVVYSDNPQRDSVDIVGIMEFPNLEFETQTVEFGACLSDTTRRVPVRITNTSAVDAVYSWVWDKESLKEDVNSIASLSLKQSRVPKPPAVQLFDILPIKGLLRPGESEVINFSFFAYPGMKASAVAMCQVEGGPLYDVTMTGESNNIKYIVEPQFIDMGQQLYSKTMEREFVITNNGKVPFDFNINTRLLSRPSIVTPSPKSGVVGPGQKETVKLRVCPGVPDRLLETILVEMAHFDPISVQVAVEGVYPAIMLGLQRIRDELFIECLAEARAAYEAEQPEMVGSTVTSPTRNGTDRLQHSASVLGVSRAASMMGDRSVAAMSVAKTHAATTTKKGPKPELLPLERKLEMEAERLRLVKLLSGAEMAKVHAEQQALLEAEIAAARAADGGGLMSMEGDGDYGHDAMEDSEGMHHDHHHGVLAPATPPRAVSTPPVPAPADVADAMSAMVSGKKRGPVPIHPPIPPLVAAQYILDFGAVVKGTSRTRKFKLVNPSSQAATLRWDKAVLESWGIKVEPEAVSKLPGLPEPGSMEVTMTLQAAKPQVALGPLELLLPVGAKGAPPVVVSIRADVQVPDLKLSQDALPFGHVQTGMTKVITLQLHNHKQVPCEWAIKKPVESTKAKDWSFFKFEPSEGVLEPGQKLNMRVLFTPIMNRDTPYSQVVPIRIVSNHKPKELLATATGNTPKILFEPGSVDCGCILPATPSQAPNEAHFKLVNTCAFPVEVFSLDFDKRYAGDEEVLKALDDGRYGDLGMMYMTPLAPGEELWPELVSEAARKKAMEAAAAEAEAAAAAEAVAAGEAPAADAGEGVGELEAVSGAPAVGAGEAEDGTEDAGPPPLPPKQLVVVYGAEQAGVTTQSKLVGARYSLPVITFDDLLFEGTDIEPPPLAEGEEPPAPPPVAEAPPPPAAKGKAKAVDVAPPPPPPVPPLDPTQQPKFDRTIADIMYNQVYTDPDLESQPGFAPPHNKLPAAELHTYLLRALRQAMYWGPQFEPGLVLDSLKSRYVDPATALKLLMEAAGMTPVMPPEPEVDPKAVKKGGKGPPTPPPPQFPDAWVGYHTVYVAELGASREYALALVRARKAKADAEAKAKAEAEAAEAAAAAEAAGEPLPATPRTPREQEPQPEHELSPEEAAAKAEAAAATAAAEAAAAEEAARAAEEALQVEADTILEVHALMRAKVAEVIGKPAGTQLEDGRVVEKTAVVTTKCEAVPDMSPEKLNLALCGISFKLGARSTVMPEVAGDFDLIPDPYLMHIVPRPRGRPPRAAISKFKVYTVRDEPLPPPPPAEPEDPKAKPKSAAKPPAKDAKGKKVVEPVEERPPLNPLYEERGRWVVPANGAIELVALFQSEEVGKFADVLGFEVVGGDRNVTLPISGVCDHPHIASDYRNVFYRKVKARPSTPSVARQFVVSKNQFEFGPLLMGKDTTGYDTGAHPDNTAKMRITNNGLFDLHVDFVLKTKSEPVDPKAKKPAAKAGADKGKGAGKGAPAGAQLDGVFVLSPASMDLKIDETQELTVYAFPTEEGPVEDVIICQIKDNPVPVEFPISVVGASPKVHVRLDDGTPGPLQAPAAAAAATPPPPTSPSKAKGGGRGKTPDAGLVNKILAEGVLFDRLLVGKKDTKTFFITNPGLLPIKWRLTGVEGLPKEFAVFPSAGELDARSELRVTVEFSALEKREASGKMNLEVMDLAELQGVATSIPIPVKGEAYKIEVDVKFPQEGVACLDYGTVRVVDDKALPLVLKNTGKYAVKFNFTLKTTQARDLFTVLPAEGGVDPGKECPVQVVFNKPKTLKREVTLVNASDINLAIIEPLTTNKEESIPIRVSVRALFSKYAITPARGINFGPLTYNTSSKPRTFEITNLGEFPFNFKLFNFVEPPPPPTPTEGEKKGGKAPAGGADKGKGAKAVAGLQLGPFTADPAEGTIVPGAKAEVALVFKADGARVFSETLGIDITERDFADSPGGIAYEIGGESCIPGIDTASLESIFEEHTISGSLDPLGAVPCQLGLRERAFNFGAVIADLVSPPPPTPEVPGKKPDPKSKVPVDIPPPPPRDLSLSAGVKAQLKFTNPIKVPCVVNFSVKPRNPLPDPKAPMAFPMDVVPAQITIPPQESRYTTIVFEPRAIAQYSATLEAVVENGSDPATKAFSCELRGEGTLPSLTLTSPSVFDPSGKPLLKFGRMLVGRSSTQQITLKNNGQMTASARLEAELHPSFSIQEGPVGVFSVEPGRSVAFVVKFEPPATGPVSHDVRLQVQQNPFEDYCISLTGEGYSEDVTLDNLPDPSKMDELRIPDGPVGTPRTAVFTLRNHSANKHFRFKWPAAAAQHLSFSPAVGHLLAGATKDITLTFNPDGPAKLSPHDVKLALTQIQHVAPKGAPAGTQPPEPVDWDDRSVVMDYESPPVTADMGSKRATPAQPLQVQVAQQEPVARPEPEPSVADVPGTNKEVLLKVFAVADNARYECGAPAAGILFKPTMMFQTRAFSFPLTNTSTARLDYRFQVMTVDGAGIDASGLYTVTPEGGAIEAGGTASIVVRFSPTEVDDCARLLQCTIPHLDGSCAPLVRTLDGKVLRPWCHFDLPDSDYISGGVRDPALPGPSGAIEPLDPATKVLEFESLGVRVRNTKRFMVLNPTGLGYEFEWTPNGATSASSSSPFRCATRKGVIGPGRQFEMVFEYTPSVDEKAEAFWTFRIPEQSITVPFLLVGHVSEPRVFFDRPAVNFGQCLVGGARGYGQVLLVNGEDIPFSFALDKASYEASEEQAASTGLRPTVEFTPSQGLVPARASLTLQATFTPLEEKGYNYNVVCRVAKKPTRLSLNVKGEGYAIHEVLQLEGSDGTTLPLAPRATNPVDFGQVIVNERAVKTLSLINTGSLAYDFVWDCGTNPRIAIKPETGTVAKGERVQVEVAYHPHGPDKLKDYKVMCQIVNGPRYVLALHGAGHKPRLDLSFVSHDFGCCALWQPGMAAARKSLRLTNNDAQPVAVDPQWGGIAGVGQTEGTDVWGIDLPACVLQPGEVKEGAILFRPAAAQSYALRVPLEINGLYTVHLDVKGEGSPLRIEPVNPAQRTVHFGAVPRGQSATRTVSIVNRGRVAATLSLKPAQSLLARLGVEALPATDVVVRPRETLDITFFYKPSARAKAWREELVVDADGLALPLLTLAGACAGTEVRLASDSMPFGAAVLGSRHTKRLALENSGDVGVKYVWDAQAAAPHWSIFPAEGFLAPGQDVKLDVTFHPTKVSPDLRAERVACRVEGMLEDVTLTLTGACVSTTPQPDPVQFACTVRATTTASIPLTNSSSSPWQLRPVITHDFFSGAEFIDVPAGGKASYTLTYRPLTMTRPDAPHEGSVFFPIPDGTGLLYRLVGKADTPVPEGVVDRPIVAKQVHTEVLTVHNWLGRPQRFKVGIERKQADKATSLTGPEYVDVPGHSSKDYKLSVFSYTASSTLANVSFTNEATGEYSFYDLKFTASPAPPQGTLALECPVRTTTSTRVTLRNPLPQEVVAKATASSKLVNVPATITLPPNSHHTVPVSYRPLLVGEQEGSLKIESPELGVYEWGLKLVGVATNPEKALAFSVPLGGRETQVFRFTHFLEDKADYKISFASQAAAAAAAGVGKGGKGAAGGVGGSAFEAGAQVSAPPAPPGGKGVEVTVEVAFEPSTIGDAIKDTLILTSPTAGEWQCPLVGRCIAPRPQGPVDCGGKGSGAVPFKNVFPVDAEFFFAVDNAAFSVKPSEKMGAKKAGAISVAYKPDPKAAGPPAKTGKLTVTCPAQTTVSWVFYLQA